MDQIIMLKEAWAMFKRRQKLYFRKIKQFDGNDIEICEQIVKQCFNGTYFQTSLGHFSSFYIRDFGICCEALIELGYKKEVEKTLQFALNIYLKNDRITTTITKKGKVVDIFSYSPDSLAFLLRCLRLTKLNHLIEMYKPFLNKKILEYYLIVIDEKTGLVRKDKQFSSMKDHSKVKSTCYNNCMTAMLKIEIELINQELMKEKLINKEQTELINPLQKYNYQELLLKYFWNGNYFNDGLFNKNNISENYISGDANIFPFWCNIFDIKHYYENKIIFNSCLIAMQKEGLDSPLPLQYTKKQIKGKYLFFQNLVANNYEGDTIWMHLGLCYLDIIAKYDQEQLKIYLEKYKEMILLNKNFLEVFNKNKSVFKTFFYECDEGMLWASKYLLLRKKIELGYGIK